ncbi:mitochondrial coenzyme A diphosphatase NUDT8 [Polymixia lowei]
MFQLSRMFRGAQILTLSCPIRPLLHGARDPHLPTLPEHTCNRWHAASSGRALSFSQRNGWIGTRGGRKDEFSQTGSSSSPLSSSSLDCNIHRLKAASSGNLIAIACLSNSSQLPQDLVSSKPKLFGPKLAFKSSHCTILEDLAQNTKILSTYHDCSKYIKCLQPKRRPWDINQPSLTITYKTQCSLLQSHLFCRKHFHRPFNSSTHRLWFLNHFQSRIPPCSFSMPQTRTFHRAAPHKETVLRDCVSLENEERCRQILGPNLKLYEGGKGRRGMAQTQGKGQGRWAAVLVSLCSVEGEPAFLFTLRSSTLKGRHKGDVSFAGGKSDPSDKDVVDTALREAREELGVTVATEKVWGVLKPLRDMSGMMIAPVLANLGPIEALSFKPNPAEVEEVFTVSLSHLCNPTNRGYTHFRTGDKYGYTLPVFRNGKHRVWGLTAVALDHTLKLIVLP